MGSSPNIVPDTARWGKIHKVRTLRDRIKIMERLHVAGLTDPSVRALALQTTRSCPARNDLCEIKAIFDMVKRRVRYTGDVRGMDTYQSATRTLEWGGGDCDDACVVLTTLLRHLGFQVGVRVADTGSNDWDHVYTIVGVPKDTPTSYVALDATVAKPMGWEAARRKQRDFIW